jgi:hypothetical protein
MAPDFRHCFLYGRALDWILRFSLLESGVTTGSCGFSVKVMAVISPLICGYLQECVNVYELYSQAFSSWDVFRSVEGLRSHCNAYIWL